MSDLVQIGDWAIPSRFAGGLARYVLHRIPTGSFLRAILMNDLTEAVGRADDQAAPYIVDLTRVIYNYVPTLARRDGVTPWLNGRGEKESEDIDQQVRDSFGRYWEEFVDA